MVQTRVCIHRDRCPVGFIQGSILAVVENLWLCTNDANSNLQDKYYRKIIMEEWKTKFIPTSSSNSQYILTVVREDRVKTQRRRVLRVCGLGSGRLRLLLRLRGCGFCRGFCHRDFEVIFVEWNALIHLTEVKVYKVRLVDMYNVVTDDINAADFRGFILWIAKSNLLVVSMLWICKSIN